MRIDNSQYSPIFCKNFAGIIKDKIAGVRCVPSSLISCDLREDLMWEDLNREDINLKHLNWEDFREKGACNVTLFWAASLSIAELTC